jgi:acyl-CoA synthetase (AMP-forming)/AMP-acid ligase II
MQGYWKDAEATRAALQDGWLKTGDLAYQDENGFIFIQGRGSDMIKSGAHRIHPKDIEEAIAELDGVADVAVVGVPDEVLGQVIKAVVIARAPGALSEMALKAHCRERLAAYKIPKFIEFATELPKTASGKVQRFKLA